MTRGLMNGSKAYIIGIWLSSIVRNGTFVVDYYIPHEEVNLIVNIIKFLLMFIVETD
jgi:hypothetical protein